MKKLETPNLAFLLGKRPAKGKFGQRKEARRTYGGRINPKVPFGENPLRSLPSDRFLEALPCPTHPAQCRKLNTKSGLKARDRAEGFS